MAPRQEATPMADPMFETKLPQLALRQAGFENVPAIPVDVLGMVDTLIKLGTKLKQRQQALEGLSRTFTIGGTTARAYTFLYGREGAEAPAAAALERLSG